MHRPVCCIANRCVHRCPERRILHQGTLLDGYEPALEGKQYRGASLSINVSNISKLIRARRTPVRVRQIHRKTLLGTPTSSSSRLGSPVMTVRAEKSTRFPIKLPRRRPSFSFRRGTNSLYGVTRFLQRLRDEVTSLSI
jgi:hypothetical protein